MAAANTASTTRTRKKETSAEVSEATDATDETSEGATVEAPVDTEQKVSTLPAVSQLLPGSVQPEEFFPVLTAQVKPGTPREHLWKSEFWSSIIKNLRPMMEVKIKYQDCSYYARAIVTAINGSRITFKVLEEFELNDIISKSTSVGPYTVKYCGLEDKHCVIRSADGRKMRKNIDSAAEAIAQAAGMMNGH